MTTQDERPEEVEDGERPRPRVVDKRISARIARGEDVGEPAPAAEVQTAQPEPAASEPAPPEPAAPQQPTATPPAPETAAEAPESPQRGGRTDVWTPEQEAEAMRIAQEIAQIPSVEWVAQAAVSLANVAGTKLELGQTADAQLAIDGLAALMNGVGSRLGSAEPVLRQTLAQLQLAYAQRAAPPPPSGPTS
ncbi:MAG TPA: hypothetical protein VHJ82_00815 [Actinomycetota bacterium]|nr:hypothetical protein [Actinomycetota bacterium]